ncbi:hypothetical protein Btru_035391 [Bulinus truncatus]|nr:hypothetical protein Btru_035391 [Bulinus truncatus]
MRMLTVYNFQWIEYLKKFTTQQNCFNTTELFNSLWTSFQYNGHLPHHLPFPSHSEDGTALTKETFIKLCEATHKLWSKQLSSSDFKRAAMVDAYNKVPRNVLRRIQKLYALDFEMFEYNIQPPKLYNSL